MSRWWKSAVIQENAIKLHYACKSPAKVKCYTTLVSVSPEGLSLAHVSGLTPILKEGCPSSAPGHDKNTSWKPWEYVGIYF